jgi:hypothetical protein
MAIDPRTQDEVYSALKSELSGRIAKLTSFVPGSFNDTWVDAFSEEVHQVEAKVLAAQLSAWPEYAGGNVDQTDLERLGVDGVTPAEVNQYMEDSHLDNLADIVGVDRDQGQTATGQVTVQTATDSTRVPEGMQVSTPGSFDQDPLVFLVDADGDGEIGSSGFVEPQSGQTEVTVDVIAESVGAEYNVGPGAITQLPDPPVGVEGVNNSQSTTGGSGVQSNESLREDVQNAVFETSGGGTTLGIVGFVEDEVTGVNDVALDEFKDQQPPFVDVIVDGGSEQDVLDAIEDSRPTGVEHNLVRPENIALGVRAEVVGTDIDTSFVNSQISTFLDGLSLDDEFRRSKLVQLIMNSDDDIEDLGSLTVLVEQITGESEVQSSGTNIYELDFHPLGNVDDDNVLYDSDENIYTLSYEAIDASSVTVIGQVDGEEYEFVQGTDYNVIDDDNDSDNDSIEFGIGGTNPDNRSVVGVEYEHSSWTIDNTITDENDVDYTKGVDWDLIDDDGDGLQDSIDWSVGGSTPSDGVRWFIDYAPKQTLAVDLAVSKREKATAGSSISVPIFDPENL